MTAHPDCRSLQAPDKCCNQRVSRQGFLERGAVRVLLVTLIIIIEGDSGAVVEFKYVLAELAEGIKQLSTMQNYSIVFLTGTREETGNVNECDDGDIESVAETYETCALTA